LFNIGSNIGMDPAFVRITHVARARIRAATIHTAGSDAPSTPRMSRHSARPRGTVRSRESVLFDSGNIDARRRRGGRREHWKLSGLGQRRNSYRSYPRRRRAVLLFRGPRNCAGPVTARVAYCAGPYCPGKDAGRGYFSTGGSRRGGGPDAVAWRDDRLAARHHALGNDARPGPRGKRTRQVGRARSLSPRRRSAGGPPPGPAPTSTVVARAGAFRIGSQSRQRGICPGRDRPPR